MVVSGVPSFMNKYSFKPLSSSITLPVKVTSSLVQTLGEALKLLITGGFLSILSIVTVSAGSLDSFPALSIV